MTKRLIVLVLLYIALSGCRTAMSASPLLEASPNGTFDQYGVYILSEGDTVAIDVVGDATLKGTYTVSETGNLFLPLVGPVIATGRTVQQIQQDLMIRVANFVRKPNLTVTITSRASFKAFFNGEFTRVGPIQLTERTTLLKAASLAGGLTPYASGRIIVVRAGGKDPRGRYAFDYDDLLRGEKGIDQFQVNRGDVIIAE